VWHYALTKVQSASLEAVQKHAYPYYTQPNPWQVASFVLWFGLDDWVIDQIIREVMRMLMPSAQWWLK